MRISTEFYWGNLTFLQKNLGNCKDKTSEFESECARAIVKNI